MNLFKLVFTSSLRNLPALAINDRYPILEAEAFQPFGRLSVCAIRVPFSSIRDALVKNNFNIIR